MKAIITGNAIVLNSTLSMEDLTLVQKYKSDALKVVDPESKETLFEVVPMDGGNGAFGADAAYLAPGLDGKASVTITKIPSEVRGNTEALKGYVADLIGGGKAYMEKLESELPGVAEAIKTERKAIMDGITVGTAE